MTSNTAVRPPVADASRVPYPLLLRSAGEEPIPAGTRGGFTLIEMLLVMAIIATISTLALPALQRAIHQARVARAIGDIEAVQIDVMTFRSGADTLPVSLAAVGRAGMLDPWGTPYQYLRLEIPGKKNPPTGQARKDRFLVPLNSDFDLYSMGKDKSSAAPLNAKASRDDIIRALDGGFIGVASKF